MPSPDRPLKANPAERSLPPQAARRSEPFGWLVVVGVSLVYAALLSLFWFERREPSAVAPEPIPVEIVAEPPAPPPPPPAPPPDAQKPAPTPDEPPATDAPRAGTEAEKPPDAPAEPAKAAAAEPPPKPPSPAPDPGAAGGPKQDGAPQAKDAAAEPAEDRPAEITRPAGEAPDDKPDAPQKRPEAAPTPPNPAGYPATTLAPMPDADFAAYARRTPFSGNANDTYLSTLYGMIVPRLHASLTARSRSAKREGTIAFTVDSSGNLLERRIVAPSGSRDLDAAAYAAVADAAPFPSPPYGGPIGLTFTYSAQ